MMKHLKCVQMMKRLKCVLIMMNHDRLQSYTFRRLRIREAQLHGADLQYAS